MSLQYKSISGAVVVYEGENYGCRVPVIPMFSGDQYSRVASRDVLAWLKSLSALARRDVFSIRDTAVAKRLGALFNKVQVAHLQSRLRGYPGNKSLFTKFEFGFTEDLVDLEAGMFLGSQAESSGGARLSLKRSDSEAKSSISARLGALRRETEPVFVDSASRAAVEPSTFAPHRRAALASNLLGMCETFCPEFLKDDRRLRNRLSRTQSLWSVFFDLNENSINCFAELDAVLVQLLEFRAVASFIEAKEKEKSEGQMGDSRSSSVVGQQLSVSPSGPARNQPGSVKNQSAPVKGSSGVGKGSSDPVKGSSDPAKGSSGPVKGPSAPVKGSSSNSANSANVTKAPRMSSDSSGRQSVKSSASNAFKSLDDGEADAGWDSSSVSGGEEEPELESGEVGTATTSQAKENLSSPVNADSVKGESSVPESEFTPGKSKRKSKSSRDSKADLDSKPRPNTKSGFSSEPNRLAQGVSNSHGVYNSKTPVDTRAGSLGRDSLKAGTKVRAEGKVPKKPLSPRSSSPAADTHPAPSSGLPESHIGLPESHIGLPESHMTQNSGHLQSRGVESVLPGLFGVRLEVKPGQGKAVKSGSGKVDDFHVVYTHMRVMS